MTDDDANLLKRLRGRHERTAGELTTVAELAEIFRDGHFAADAIARLTRERDEARAALASARNDALDEAAIAARRACQRHEGADAYSMALDRAAIEQMHACVDAIRAMKREPADD